MIKYITRKILYSLLVLYGVITVIFFLFNVLPGDPATIMLGQRANKEAIEAIHKDLGTDRPIMEQYAMYLNDLSPISIHNNSNNHSHWFLNPEKYNWKPVFVFGGNKSVVIKLPYLRRSYITKRRVSDIIIETLPETAVLAFTSIVIASIVGIFLGIISAIKRNTIYDRLSLVLAVLGMAAPSFFVGLIVAIVQGGLNRIINPKLGDRNSVMVGLLFYAAGFALFALATKGWMMYAFMIPFGLGGIAGPALQSIISKQVPANLKVLILMLQKKVLLLQFLLVLPRLLGR